ncbi:PREDICTED: uncharacterized protein LOC18593279 isoform X1 [Theobroma cacao]|uniref:Uncharacterized protein LOC18593279 isoform X1 n=1 Tax=Theobroma cacao TaxID=3641 RepID=A0AB32WNN4_THECC|nr:PREDICTED: uncharacterized protein LOC18593279 isoform X1 [Theobroma cacao]XP_017980260.1 PREDICTED: uncharacterized protein LOC18593279 isoform X1 [Theobroma cacao]
MSTIEKVLVQIFERKDRIIDHVKQQILLFDHHLASKCLIDGFVPPPWLLSTSHTELNKEDLISGLLHPNPQPSIPYYSLYQQPVDNVQLPSVLCTRVDAWNEGLDQCLSGKGDELDPSVTSPPQDCGDGMISDICPDPGLSLARIQRSRSRQRALEHRSSVKACKNIESSDKNGDACNSQNKGSKIACLWSDSVDKLELIRSCDNVVSYAEKEEERRQCWSKERSENVYSGRVTRSRSSVQPPKSVSGPSDAGNTSCVAKQDGVVHTESTGNSGQQPDVLHELLESNFVEPFHNTVSCAVKNEENSQCQSKERGEDVYSGRITRSRSSGQPPKSVNGPPSAKQDGIVLTESINKSRLQSDAADELLQFVKPVGNVVTCVLAKEERSQCQSKERAENIYSGSITRSRSSVQSPKSVNGLSCAGKASDAAKQDGDLLIKSTCQSKQQPNAVDELLESVKPAVMSDESCGYIEARDHLIKEKESNVYQGRLTRSRSSSQQHNCVNKHLKLDSCPDRSIDDGICKSMQLACHVNDLEELIKPFDISDESCGIKAKTSDYETKENAVVDQYNDGSTRSGANCSAKLFKLVDSSNTLEYEVTQCKSTASNKSPYAKSSDSSEGVELKEVPDTQVDSLPCANDSNLADLNQCVAIVADTDADSDELVESHSASSASNLDGANNPPLEKSLNRYERIELEVVVTSPHSASAMIVMPKQLDFDNLGECTLNEASSPALESEEEIKSLKERPLAWLPSADKLDEVTPVHYQEKYNSSPVKQLLEEREAYSKEEKQSETDLNKTSGPGRTSNLNVVLSVKETPEASTDAVTSMLPESNKISEQKIFMEHHSTTLKVSNENLLGNSKKDASGSRLNADTGTNYLFEKDYRKLAVLKSATSVPEECNCNTNVCSGPAILADIDFNEVCSPALLRKVDATSTDAIEHPFTALIKETKGHSVKQKMELCPSQNRNADSMGRCIADDTDSVQDPTHAKSSERKFAIQFVQPGRHSGSHVEGSWPHKRRKIGGQQSNSLSLSLSLKDEDVMQLNANKSLVDEEDQNTGKCSWKESSRSEAIPSTFMHKQFAVASVSSLPQETLENSEDHSAEGTGAVGPSSIMFGSTRKCTADENQILLNVGDKSEFGNIEQLTCDERSEEESKSQLGEDGEFSTCPISSPCQPPADLISADQTNPELEGFIMQTDSEQICIGGDGISFDKLDLPKTTIERASLLEQLCKSACIHTPLSQFPTTYKLHRTTDLYQSVPNGLLECVDPKSTLPINDDRKSQLKASTSCFGEDTNHAFLGGYFSDRLPFSSSQVTGDVKKPYLSPVGKLWDRIASNSGSSEKRGSLNLELPCINEENENTDEVVDAFQEGSTSKIVTCSVQRKPLTEIRECPNVPASVSGAEIFTVRDSLDSVNTTYSFTGTKNGVKQKAGKHNASKRRETNKMKENLSIPPGANGTKRASESLRNGFSKPKLSGKTSLRNGGPSFSQKKSKVNNIVSNVTSFIPMVQQKQAAAIITGKRDVKVKALEAAEAAKRLAEKKENDRKMKKEALKLERARLEQENLRQLEIEKKKKEEERKKKEADMAAKKRQREEEERLEKERKRKRMEEARRQQRAPEEKLCAKKDEKEKNCQAPDEKAQTMTVPNNEAVKHEQMQKEIADRNEGKMLETELRTAVASISDAVKASMAVGDCNAKVPSTADRATTESDSLIADTSREQSYDISPYKGSDDEDEEEEDDDEPNSKFIPSWASKNRVALVVTSQQKLDPEVIFPPKSFCSIAEVLLPRKLQQNRVS